jgi:hypothetical protein
MRFFKGNRAIYEDIKAEVSLATACFHIGQGFGFIKGLYIGVSSRIKDLRMAKLNRPK